MRKLITIALVAGCMVAVLGSLQAVTRLQGGQQKITHSVPAHGAHQGMRHQGSISGRVFNLERKPVAGAVVYAEREHFLMGVMPFAQTDEQGMFSITRLEPGTYQVYAAKEEDGYPLPTYPFYSGGTVIIPQVSVGAGKVTPDVAVFLAPKALKLSGRVKDAVTNRHINRAQITLRRVDNPNYYFQTGLDEQGSFKILVPAVAVQVEVSAPGYKKRDLGTLTRKPGETNSLNVVLHQSQ